MVANNPRAHEPVDRQYLDLTIQAVDAKVDSVAAQLRADMAEARTETIAGFREIDQRMADGFARVERRFGELERRMATAAFGIAIPLFVGIVTTLVAVS